MASERKLTSAQVTDIREYLKAHKWNGARKAICRKHKISYWTMRHALEGTAAYSK